ncbi:MAG: DNA metabolism protein [Sphingobacteriales bacterium]|nr:MAG: DNA metabolism protein [Sphingobacteriales bacterium]
MTTLTYDATFGGFLTAVFEVYERKLGEVTILPEAEAQEGLFGALVRVQTVEEKQHRVWHGLKQKLSVEGLKKLYSAFLSELPDWENQTLSAIRHVFAYKQNVEDDFGHSGMLWITQTARKVWREKHRMEAFVRFQKLQDGLFYAFVEPDSNVLPLITKHFRSRYADQDWLIYDGRRRYGIHYTHGNGEIREVQLEWTEDAVSGKVSATILDAREELFQTLWRDYFKHTGIPARKNPRLHLQHMPVRYWKHLTEKMIG